MSGSLVDQVCIICRAPVVYEGCAVQRPRMVSHRFHCHACGRGFAIRTAEDKRPGYTIKPEHEVAEFSAIVPLPPPECPFWQH